MAEQRTESLPVIDVAPLFGSDGGARARTAAEIGAACRSLGFFYATGHAIDDATMASLMEASRRFFALPEPEKMNIAMARGGRAWRGFFPVGGELTSGKPDIKEGVYFGEELGAIRPAREGRTAAARRQPVSRRHPGNEAGRDRTSWARRKSPLTRSWKAIAMSLGLDAQYFRTAYTSQPTMLFRIFHYPASAPDRGWGVGEHTDYGLLTLLAQDDIGGLAVKTPGGWIDAPPIEGALVCNIGDMLDRLTGGAYRSTPHRVLNTSGRSRLSFPFFFDPGFDARIVPSARSCPLHPRRQRRAVGSGRMFTNSREPMATIFSARCRRSSPTWRSA